MARVSGNTSRVYVDEYAWHGLTNNLAITFDSNLPEVTSMGDGGASFVEGQYNVKATINGFFDPADDSYDEQMFAVIGDNAKHYVGLFPGSDASYGDVGYEIVAQASKQDRPAEVNGAVLLNVKWQGESTPAVATEVGGTYRATVLCNGAVTATGAVANSAQNIGVTTAGQHFATTLRILVDDITGITVKIQESSDNGATDPYADLLTFTAATGITYERKTTIAATEAWKRVYISAFAGTSATILITVGTIQGT